ncbi:DUF21 domain-containing protein [bacterium]|nr:DUF21 domain-containing protein [bacterium]
MFLFKGLILVILLMWSFFFSLMETIFVSLDKFKIREIKEKKSFLSIDRLLEKPSWWLTDILIGNTLVNIIFTTMAISMAVDVTYRWSIKKEWITGITAVLVMVIILVFGEIIPKTLARVQTVKFFSLMIKPFLTVDKILVPASKLFLWITNLFIKPGKEQPEKTKVTKKELYFFLRTGRKEGALEEEEEKIIYRVLDLKDISAERIMTPRNKIDAISLSQIKDKEELFYRVMEIGRSRIPVYKDSLDNIKGILYVKDLLSVIRETESFSIINFMHSTFFVEPDIKIDDLFKEFNAKKIHIALVKEKGILKGLITMEDIIEEIVGEILDEYDLGKIRERQYGGFRL